MASIFISARPCFEPRMIKRLVLSLAMTLAMTLAVVANAQPQANPACKAGTLYLTFDTGNMRFAELIAEVLDREKVKATFFLSNEKTSRGDYALDPSWTPFWKARVREGHAFGSHTFDHVYFKGETKSNDGRILSNARPQFGAAANQVLAWDSRQICEELDRVKRYFQSEIGHALDPIWRAPGGRAPTAVMRAALGCGYQHFYWAEAGFLGDELPSDRYPNKDLVERALRQLRGGDVIMAHLGIWSRKDPFAPMLQPLIEGLKSRGFCFATLREHPDYPQVKRH